MESEKGTIIHMWCGPRSLSTATMYSFSQRPDTIVLDEPLYASHLSKNPQLTRPYRGQLLAEHETDGNKVISQFQSILSSNTEGKSVLFVKHMAKQFDGLNINLLQGSNVRHLFLIRDPLDMIHSWGVKESVHQEGASLSATSLPDLVRLYSELRLSGRNPTVVDSGMLIRYPKGILQNICSSLGIEFFEQQLSWPAGPKPCDGLWASFWYDRVHQTTGFQVQTVASLSCSESTRPSIGVGSGLQYKSLTSTQLEVYRECLPFYDMLHRRAIGVDTLCPASSLPTTTLDITAVEASSAVRSPPPRARTTLLDDPRNENILAWVGDRVVPRELACVSVFDSAVQGGDAVWEGLRVYSGRVFKLQEHCRRLMNSARAMAFTNVPSMNYIQDAVFQTLAANGMRDGAHMRLTLTRGAKITSSMNPAFNVFGCNLIILPEWKPVGDAATYDNNKGIVLVTAAGRRNGPQCVDSKIHHNNLINNILPKIQANLAGAADALMLDTEGFVSETNATNVFMVKDGMLITPHADYCLPGITRETVIRIAMRLVIPFSERRVSLAEFHCADEVFTTGTMGELTPVTAIDGRVIGRLDESGIMHSEVPGPVLTTIQSEYRKLTQEEGIPIPEFI